MLINNALWAYLIDVNGYEGIDKAIACGYTINDYRETRAYYMYHHMDDKCTYHNRIKNEDIIRLLNEGKKKYEVARLLGCSTATIKYRLKKIKKETSGEVQ